MDFIEGHTRAFLKVEDGCDQYCAYCIIPYARGYIRSLDSESITTQAVRFAKSGYREIVLTGINLSSYGKGESHDLADAVSAAAKPDGILRIRLSSLEPELMTVQLLDRLAAEKKLAPQFHLSLQSGADRTLSAMRRRYTVAEYEAVADEIRRRFHNPTFTTDIMVGFPGESDADFEKSLKFVRNFGFLKCHVFPYSVRAGTPAAAMPQLQRTVKEARSRRMIDAANDSRREILQSFNGETVRVILEQRDTNGNFTGYSDRYIPVTLSGKELKNGDVVSAKITGVNVDTAFAEPQRKL